MSQGVVVNTCLPKTAWPRLAPLDSYRELADGIRLLYKDPDLFKRMSKSATERVARQTAKVIVIEQEMSLITGARREFSNDGASL